MFIYTHGSSLLFINEDDESWIKYWYIRYNFDLLKKNKNKSKDVVGKEELMVALKASFYHL